MKNKTYFLSSMLAVVLGVALVTCVIIRTVSPAVIIPDLDIPNMVLLSLIALLLDLLATLFEETRSQDTYCDTVHQCIRYLRSHFTGNVTLETLGALTGYSGLQLTRLFLRDTGRTPHKWLTAIRMQQARHLLTETELTLDAIAAGCGFSSVSHFKALFKEANGCSPGAYRKSARIG